MAKSNEGTLLGVHDSMFFVIIPLPLHSVSMFYLPVLSQEQLTSPSLGFLVSSSSSTSSLPPSYDSVIVVVLVDHVGVDVVEKWSPTHTKTWATRTPKGVLLSIDSFKSMNTKKQEGNAAFD